MMAREDLDLVPIVDDDGALAGVMTERALARRYIRESREPSELDAPTRVSAIAHVLAGRSGLRHEDAEVSGQIWCMAMDIGGCRARSGRATWSWSATATTRSARRSGSVSGLLVASNGTTPTDATLALAVEKGVPIVCSPLDSYVTARMVTLSAPCRALMDPEPLTVRPDDLLSDVADEVKEVHYRAAVAVDTSRRPIGLVTRTDLLNPRPRRVLLVDHAEQAQSVIGVEQAEIVEILDHHHIGSIETTVPVRATFDPVGSTATLVVERFRQNGMEPSRSTAILLLCAILSDTVILNSPTTTERDWAVVEYLQRVLVLEPMELGREMFTATSDLAGVPASRSSRATPRSTRSRAGRRSRSPRSRPSARASTTAARAHGGDGGGPRRRGYVLYALMVTDILAKDTELYVAGDPGPWRPRSASRPTTASSISPAS